MVGNAASWGRGLLGATAGGVLGYFGFPLVQQLDFAALILPGAFVGIGCGLLSRHDSAARGAVCGMAALVLGLLCEWHYFLPKDSLEEFFHFLPLAGIGPLVVIIFGSLLAFGCGRGQFRLRKGPTRQPVEETPPCPDVSASSSPSCSAASDPPSPTTPPTS